METKHTPGPWVSCKNGVRTSANVEPNRVGGYGVSNDFICCLNDGEYHQYFDHEEQEANASLIAAAPDLLEALTLLEDAIDVAVELLQQPEENQQILAIEIQRRREVALAAIAKATAQ